MDNYCGECARYDANGRSYYGNEHYCEKKGKTYPANKKACESFVPRSKGGYKPAGSEWKRFGLFMTIIQLVLGHTKESDELISMISLENYMAKSSDGQKIVEEYYQISPLISSFIMAEPNTRLHVAQIIMDTFIKPCCELVKNSNFTEATHKFITMIEYLKKRYNLENFQVDETIISSDEDLGKGRIKLKPQMV